MGLYDPILTSAGVLQDGKLSQSSKDKYWDAYLKQAKGGNPGGVGILRTQPMEGAEKHVEVIKDRKNADVFHSTFLDTLYEGLAIQLDVPGQTALFPVFDVTAAFPGVKLPLPFTLPDLAAQLKITPPELNVKLLGLGINVKIPPELPSIPIPKLPKIPDLPKVPLGLPQFTLPDLILGLFKLPFDLLKMLLLPPKIDMVLDLPGLPTMVFKLAYDIVFNLLVSLNLVIPSVGAYPLSLLTAINVFLDNVVTMITTVIVGKLLGTGGVSRSVAASGGLV